MFMNKWGKKLIYGGSLVGTCVGLYVIFEDTMKLKTFEKEKVIETGGDPRNMVYLVTGANSGIGRSLAWELAAMQHKVFLLCRDMKKCEKTREMIVLDTKNKYVYCRPCDLSSQKSIRDFVDEFKKNKFEGIDGLCNNGGVMDIKDRNTTSEGIEQQFGVNHVGHFLLTRLLEDMIKAKKGRIVYLLNLDYRLGVVDFSDINFTHRKYNPSTAYKQSQLANAMFIQHYSKLNSPDVLTINGAYPGVCNTNIKRHMSVERSFFGSYVSGPFLNLFGRQSIEGAQTPLKLLIDPSLEGVTGKLFSNLEEINVNDKATQNDLNTRLYLMDEYWTDLITHEDLVKSNVRVQSKTNE
uniref:Uncharacterized protein n=1 Tax=Lepeophtheirus salmonis TaxID=72036 RepID=A0A0K2UQE0_LEPSM